MLEPKIIFEDEDFIAINKPVGMMVHGVKISSSKKLKNLNQSTLVDWLIKRHPELKKVGDDTDNRPGIVHRLDKDTSGIILIPKTQKYFLYLKSLFQNHKIKKTYLAIVFGIPKLKEGTIDKPIGIKDGTIKRSVYSTKHLKEAITKYKILKSINISSLEKKITLNSELDSLSLLEVTPQTGRTHQIRVHLSSIGNPILGDALYSNKNSEILSNRLKINHQMLHALSLEFDSKLNNKIVIETKPPINFLKYFE